MARSRKGIQRNSYFLDQEETADILVRYQKGETQSVLAKEFNVTDAAIFKLLKKHGITKHPRSKITQNQEKEILHLYAQGESTNAIGPKVGLSGTTCVNILRKNGVSLNNFLITKDEDSEILRLYESGLTYEAVASKLNINQVSCHNALKRNGLMGRSRDAYPPAHKIYNQIDSFFEIVDTEEKAYWLGFIAADGNVNKTLDKITVKLSTKDEAHLEKFKISLKSDAKIFHAESIYNGKTNFSSGVAICSKKMANDLNNLGITPRKSLTLKPWSGPIYLMPSYWRGYIDGDGCISKYKDSGMGTISLVGTKEMVVAFVDWANAYLGIQGTSIRELRAPVIPTEGKISGKHSVFSAQYFSKKCNTILEILYANAKVYLDRKYKRAMSLVHDKPEDWVIYE